MKKAGLFLGAALLVSVLILAVYAAILSARAAGSALEPPLMPLTRTPADVGIADYQDVSMLTSDGVRLRGWYVPPRGGRAMAIVLAHGYAQNRQQLLPEAAILAVQGYGVLLFDFRGHGESEQALVTLGDRETLDLEAAVDFCAGQPGIASIGAIGFSMGGATLAQVAARDERLSAVAIVASFSDLRRELGHRARLLGPLSQLPALRAWRQAGVAVNDVRPVDDLCAISPRPLLLAYGEQDRDIAPGTAQRMSDAVCPPAEVWIVDGAGHQNLFQVVPDEYAARLTRLFGQIR